MINENRVEKRLELPHALNIDLMHMYFIAPYHVVSLACLIEEYHMKGVKICFTKGETQATRYLNNLGFFYYWEDDFDRKKYHPEEIKTSFCLWQLDKEMFHPYVTYAHEYFSKHFFSGLDLQPLNTSLTELFNNVIDHSESKVSGYVFTQWLNDCTYIIFNRKVIKGKDKHPELNKDSLICKVENVNGFIYTVSATFKGKTFNVKYKKR